MSHIKVIPLALLGEHFTNKKKWKCRFGRPLLFSLLSDNKDDLLSSLSWEMKKCDCGPLLLSFCPCSQAPPSPPSWTAHLTTSIWASALILVSQLLVFTWNIQVKYLCPTLSPILFLHNTDWVFVTFVTSYWSGVVSGASDSELRDTARWQIHGGRCRAVFMWTGILSSGKSHSDTHRTHVDIASFN